MPVARVLGGGAIRFPEVLIYGPALIAFEGVHEPIVPASVSLHATGHAAATTASFR